jgi:hypothetical protein
MKIAGQADNNVVATGSADLPMRRSQQTFRIAAGLAGLALLTACSDSDVEPGRFTVGGTVSGLAGGEVVLQNNGIDTLGVGADGAFAFSTTLTHGDPYEVTILAQPAAPRQVCVIDNGSGRMPGGNVGNVAVDCYPGIVLAGTPASGGIEISWNAGDFAAGTTFNLCRAEAPIDGGIANCAAHDGGALVPGAESPHQTGVLAIDTRYWFLLEAAHPDGRRTLSTMIARSIPAGFDGPFAELNDSGIDFCADDTANLASGGSSAQKTAGCDQVAATHPGQDGHLGRDAAFRAGTLVKTGTGAAGFDFTRICNSGEAAGASAFPAAPLLGPNPNDWGCVRDNVTSLLWEVKPGGLNQLRSVQHSYSWFDPAAVNQGVQDGGFCAAIDGSCADPAFNTDTHAYIQAVNATALCGTDDWRLPTVDELHTISHQGRVDPAISQANFPDTTGQVYWSATTVAGFGSQAWFVDFATGNDGWDDKSSAYRIRAASGQAWAPAAAADIPPATGECEAGLAETTPSGDFTAVGDGGIVRHVPTGLEWQRCAQGQEWDGVTCAGTPTIHDWREALALAEVQPGWRLPNVNELRTLAERCRIAPAINRQVFPDAPAAAFSTSSPSAANPDRAWVVNFLSGNDNPVAKRLGTHVRLVRDAQQ